MKQLLRSVRIRNFKAIEDTGRVSLGPLTVLIGHNGSGKSSFIEALETLQAIVHTDLDRAMVAHHGFEHAWNKAVPHTTFAPSKNRPPPKERSRPYCINPMTFELHGTALGTLIGNCRATMDITSEPGVEPNRIFIQHESVVLGKETLFERDDTGRVRRKPKPEGLRPDARLQDGESVLKDLGVAGLGRWQFLTLVPQQMGEPVPQRRAGGEVRLAKDGGNIAQYLRWIRDEDLAAYDGIVDAMQIILSYAQDVQAALTSELERTVYLQVTEKGFKLPGWLLSTGTVRILALLALLRSPSPPPLLVVEEIENGLDPRTIGLVVDEIRSAVGAGDTQIILTTHSPYLLDKLSIDQIVTVERSDGGSPVFRRPAEEKELRQWAAKFAPGSLYSMGMLRSKERRVR